MAQTSGSLGKCLCVLFEHSSWRPIDVQAEQVFINPERVLRANGSSLRNVIKVTIFLRNMSNFSKIIDLRGRYFTPPYPADTIVEVKSLYSSDALLEIEAIAVVDEVAERM